MKLKGFNTINSPPKFEKKSKQLFSFDFLQNPYCFLVFLFEIFIKI